VKLYAPTIPKLVLNVVFLLKLLLSLSVEFCSQLNCGVPFMLSEKPFWADAWLSAASESSSTVLNNIFFMTLNCKCFCNK